MLRPFERSIATSTQWQGASVQVRQERRPVEDLPHETSWRLIAPWYSAYLILGLIVSGLLPFLLPLMVVQAGGDPSAVAYVIGGYNLGLLAAPLLGAAAERYGAYRGVFFAGFVATALALAALPLVSGTLIWMVLTTVIGVGAAASATVATLFVVDFTPQREWDARIGWLQSFNGAGQVGGLLLAGVAGGLHIAGGLWIAAALAALALVVGRLGLPTGPAAPQADNRRSQKRLSQAIGVAGSAPIGGAPLHHSHRLFRAAWHALPALKRTPFVWFLGSWAAYNFGVAAFFAYYPLLMQHSFDIAPRLTAFVYAAAAGIGIGLFVLAGKLAVRHGARAVYMSGLLLRIAGLGMLTLSLFAPPPFQIVPAISGFAVAMLAWPVLSVSGTALAARLTAVGEGAAIGLLNAIGALATVLGTFLGGPLVQGVGYNAVLIVGLAGMLGAVVLGRGAVASIAVSAAGPS